MLVETGKSLCLRHWSAARSLHGDVGPALVDACDHLAPREGVVAEVRGVQDAGGHGARQRGRIREGVGDARGAQPTYGIQRDLRLGSQFVRALRSRIAECADGRERQILDLALEIGLRALAGQKDVTRVD